MYLHNDDITRSAGVPDVALACVVAPVTSEAFTTPAYGSTFTILACITHPTSRAILSMSGPNRKDALQIDPHYLETEYDRLTSCKALLVARTIASASPLASWIDREILPGPNGNLDEFISRAACTTIPQAPAEWAKMPRP